MATSKPISTISYNTEGFLKDTLNDLINAEKITFWSYIKHKADVDDKKDHIHLRVVPNRLLDTMALANLFVEPVAGDKPLKCMLWRPASEADWILYCEHNELYLTCKNLVRNIEYTYNDFVTSDSDEFQLQYNAAIEYLHSILARDYITEKQIKDGVPLHELAYNGLITSKNAFRMKQFRDIYCKKTNDLKFQELCKTQSQLEETIAQYKEAIEFYRTIQQNPFVGGEKA